MAASVKLATATEVHRNFGSYLQYAIDNGEVIILRNGKRVARIISEEAVAHHLTDSLRGVLSQSCSDTAVREVRTARYTDAE